MKRITLLLLAALLLCGCGREQEETLPSFSLPSEAATIETTQAAETEAALPQADFSFGDLQYWEFHFDSGSGGWGTVLLIRPDGSFTGTFQDFNMGMIEPEYPNGCISLSDFSGQFSQPEWVDPHTATLKITDIQYEKEPGTAEILEGIQYNYETAYGLTETEELVLYLPGTPLEKLPEDYLLWTGLYDEDYLRRTGLSDHEGTELSYYGLYNPGQKSGFYSLNVLDTIRNTVQAAEEIAADVDEWLSESATQADMNDAAHQKYLLWDEALNQLWQDLKGILSEEEMRRLTVEELQWIEEKEQAALAAAGEYEGGSLYPAVYYGTLADLTRQRAYELLEYLP